MKVLVSYKQMRVQTHERQKLIFTISGLQSQEIFTTYIQSNFKLCSVKLIAEK